MTTATQQSKSVSEPGTLELIEATGDGLAGFGLAFMSFLGAIPGLLPVAGLTIVAGVVLLIPMLVIGLVVGALWGVAVLIIRLARRIVSMLTTRDSPAEQPCEDQQHVINNLVPELHRP